jgi:MarR family transcriptional regulator, organic hydroperoxide resistance regulator
MKAELDADDREPLGFALGAAARKLAKFYTKALVDHKLTPSQLFFLRQLWREDGLQLRELGLCAQLDATSATWLTDQLEKAGLIERKRDDPDRRAVHLWLTQAGQALHADLEPELKRWEQALEDELARHHSLGEITTFRAVLATLVTVLPDGDDLWEARSASWDAHLHALRTFAESSEEKGTEANHGDNVTRK